MLSQPSKRVLTIREDASYAAEHIRRPVPGAHWHTLSETIALSVGEPKTRGTRD